MEVFLIEHFNTDNGPREDVRNERGNDRGSGSSSSGDTIDNDTSWRSSYARAERNKPLFDPGTSARDEPIHSTWTNITDSRRNTTK